MVLILAVFDETGFDAFRFRHKIFDTGTDFLPIIKDEPTFSAGGGLGGREENIITIKKQVKEIEITAKPSSIDDLLISEDMGGLSGLASASYIRDRKSIPLDNVLAYIFIPNSRLNAINDNYPVGLVYRTIEFPTTVPYSRGYEIGRLDSDYSTEQEYGPVEEVRERLQTYEAEPMIYIRLKVQYDLRLFGSRDLLYTKPANDNNYGVFEFKVPEVSFADKVDVETAEIYTLDNFTPKVSDIYTDRTEQVVYPKADNLYKLEIKPIPREVDVYKSEIEPITVPRNSIETVVQSEVQRDYENVVRFTPKDFPKAALLEETVEENSDFTKAKVVYLFPNRASLDDSVNLPLQQQDTRDKNPESDISNVVNKAFEQSDQEQQEIVYQENEPDKVNDITQSEPANDNTSANNNYREQQEYLVNDRDPERRKNNFEWSYEKVKNKSKSILKNMNTKLKELYSKGKDYLSKNASEPKLQLEINSDETSTETLSENISVMEESKVHEAYSDEFYTVNKLTINKKAENSSLYQQAVEWLSEFESLEDDFDCKASFAYIDTETGAYIGYNDDEEVDPACTTKIAIMYAALYLSMNGELDLNATVKNTESKKRRIGTKRHMEKFDQEEYTVLELINNMMEDNYPGSILLAYIGRRKINDTLTEMGYEKTIFKGFYRDGMRYEDNRTTMRETVYMKYNITNSALLDELHKQIAVNAMRMDGKNSYIFDGEQPELMKIGNSKNSVGISTKFSNSENPHVSALILNTTKDLYDEQFQSIPGYTNTLYSNFFKVLNKIANPRMN